MASAVFAVAPLLFASGLCALVYQVGWQRELRLIFGASTAASAAVLAVFMGGLGLGGLVLGPRADRHLRPLRFYAGLEALVALSAAASPTLLAWARDIYASLGGTVVLGGFAGTALRLLLAALVLVPPTFLAGGTLGAAVRAVEQEGDRRRRGAALLYGANAAGALAGCLVATFWLLESLGTRTTLWLAALLNLVVAAAAVAFSQKLESAAATPEPVEAAEAAAPSRFVLGASAAVGFAFFLMELVWYRMLGPILGGTVYTFGLVLAMALLGIAVGGFLYPAVFARRRVGLAAFAATCLVEAAAIAVPYALGDRIALVALDLRPAVGASLWGYLPGWTVVAAVVIFLPSLVAGLQFPLLIALLGQGRARVAAHVGRAYFWNTVGAMAGALAGGFGLMPFLSAPGCWKAVVLLLAVLALAALAVERASTPVRWVLAGAGIVVASVPFLAEGPTAVWRHSGIGAGRATVPEAAGTNARRGWQNDVRRSVVWEREGVESSVAVQTLAGLSFVINGKVDGNARNDAPTQVMGGLLGPLMRPGARRALVVGLGTGSTAGWLAAVPTMERTDVVELEPAILEVARMCAAVNRDVMSNPRVQVLTGDAREVLTAGRETYDLVFSEPSNPYRAGVASLFTREFYEAVARRLAPEGLFLQWVQAYEVDDWTISTVVSTVGAVFPEVEVWHVHENDLLIVATRTPLRRDAAELRDRIRQEPFATALRAAWRAVELEDVLARFLAGPALARDLRERGHPLNTDDRNRIEFAFARTLSRSGLFEVARMRRAARALGADRPTVAGDVDWDRVARQRVALYTIAGSSSPPDTESSEAERLRARAHGLYVSGDLAAAARALDGLEAAPEGLVEKALAAEGLADLGDSRAVALIQELRRVEPVEAEAATARLAWRMGQVDLAVGALASAFTRYRSDPWPGQVSLAQALGLADQISKARPETVPVLFEALGPPFAVAALDEPRKIMRLSVESHGGPAGIDRCRQALDALEPHVPWRADVLRYRVSCYERTRDPRVGRARADLAQFQRDEGPSGSGDAPSGSGAAKQSPDPDGKQ